MVASAQRLEHGRFYTARPVVDLVLSLTLRGRWPPRKLLDPSCGDGAFLRAAAARGLSEQRLHGSDTDAAAVGVARAHLPGASLCVRDLFADCGGDFDAIVGNPPYVRQERLGASTKRRLIEQLARTTGDSALANKLVGRGDLAACVLARSAALLSPGGRLGFVVSGALLEADYAAPLWTWLARRGSVTTIATAPTERWFADASVNTVVVVFEREAEPRPVSLARLRVPTLEAASRLAAGSAVTDIADVRVDGSADPRRWATLLRCSELWLKLEGDRRATVPLRELAVVQRGVTSGANDVFYLTTAEARRQGIESSLLVPLVRAPPRVGAVPIHIDPPALASRLLCAPAKPAELARFPGAAAYLERHVDAGDRPSTRHRTPWWSLPSRRARIFLTKAYASRFVQRFSAEPLECDQRVYAVNPLAIEPELLAAVLNGSASALAIESLGRASMGEGALEWTVADARRLPLIDPRHFSRDQRESVLAAFRQLAKRPIGNAGSEVGRGDRLALDLALAENDPGLFAHAAQLASAVADSARERESRARQIVEQADAD